MYRGDKQLLKLFGCIIFYFNSLIHIYIDVCARVCVCEHVCIESSAAPGKGMPAKWQMVGINLASSLSPCMSTPPTWLPTLPRVYFPPRTRSAHPSPRRASLLTSKVSCELTLHQVQATPVPPVFQPMQRCSASVSSQGHYARRCFPKRKYHCLKTNKLKEQDRLPSLKIGSDLFEV